jgi:hypothetical protein
LGKVISFHITNQIKAKHMASVWGITLPSRKVTGDEQRGRACFSSSLSSTERIKPRINTNFLPQRRATCR